MAFSILPLERGDEEWVRAVTRREWGDEFIVVHSTLFYPHQLPGIKAVCEGEIVGLGTYKITNKSCEIITLNSFRPGSGIGSALLQAIEKRAKEETCFSCTLVTTNDNLYALGFYQKRGYVLAELRAAAVETSRKTKPSIPLIGEHGIPIRDEIVLKKTIVPTEK